MFLASGSEAARWIQLLFGGDDGVHRGGGRIGGAQQRVHRGGGLVVGEFGLPGHQRVHRADAGAGRGTGGCGRGGHGLGRQVGGVAVAAERQREPQ